MKTVQMTLDEQLVRQVNALAKKLKTSRSAFTREGASVGDPAREDCRA